MTDEKCIIETVTLPKGTSVIRWMEDDQVHHIAALEIDGNFIGIVNTSDKKVKIGGNAGLSRS